MALTHNYHFLFFVLYAFVINVQKLPPIQLFNPQTYKGATQNWSISQADNKFIYVANKGLFESKIVNWRPYGSLKPSVNILVSHLHPFN